MCWDNKALIWLFPATKISHAQPPVGVFLSMQFNYIVQSVFRHSLRTIWFTPCLSQTYMYFLFDTLKIEALTSAPVDGREKKVLINWFICYMCYVLCYILCYAGNKTFGCTGCFLLAPPEEMEIKSHYICNICNIDCLK